MKEIYFEYNPFTLEYIVEEDGEKFYTESPIYEYINGNKRLQFWIDKLIPILYKKINESFNLTFRGTVLDYDDLQLEVDYFNKTNKTDIKLIYEEVRSVEDRLKELKYLFGYMIDTAPFEELKEEKVIKQFYEAIGKEFELAVIATINSGKSTLLNSFLGRYLMPSNNNYHTATIVRIKDVDGMEGISAVCRDSDENIIINEVSNVTVENIKEFNDNEKVSYIDIKMDIPFVSSHHFDLVLLDTPGPNNSRDERHKEKTYKVINESEPLILYVLNNSQGIGTNDDNFLLSSVSNAMKEAGKQSKDRFIFVVNKIDDVDLEAGESIKSNYNDVVSYLKSHGIENPNIYLVSAQSALTARLIKNNYKPTSKQESDFDRFKKFCEKFDDFHLSKYASLLKNGKDKINNMLNNAKDDLDKLLVHSGVPAVEIAINDYLEKYAMSDKIKKAVDSFIVHIKERDIENKLADELSGNETKLKEFNEQIAYVSKQIADGNRGKEYKKKIEALDISKEIDDELDRIFGDFGYKLDKYVKEAFEQVSGKNSNYRNLKEYNVNKQKGEEYRKKIEQIVKELLIKFSGEIESQIYSDIICMSNSMINEYRKEINSLLEEITTYEFKKNKSYFHVNNLLNSLTNQLDSEIDKHIKHRGISLKMVNIFPLIIIRLTDKFDILGYNNDVLAKVTNNIQKECVRIKKYANEGLIKEIKETFLSHIDKLEIVVSNKINSLKNITSSKDKIEKFIEKNKENKLWLEDFMKKLNSVIEL